MSTEDQTAKMQRVHAFHDHLDVCSQCRNNPLRPCTTGYDLLLQVAAVVSRAPVPSRHALEKAE